MATDKVEDVNISKVYFKDELLIVDSPKLIKEIKIYDSLGRLVAINFPSSQYFELYVQYLSKGSLYIVELIDVTGKSFTKKVLYY